MSPLFLAALLMGGATEGGEPPGLVVLPLLGEGEASVRQTLEEQLVKALSERSEIGRVVVRADLVARLSDAQRGCDDEDCAKSLASLVDQPLLLAGSLGAIDGMWSLALRLLDLRSGAVLGRSSCSVSQAELAVCAARAADELAEAVSGPVVDDGSPKDMAVLDIPAADGVSPAQVALLGEVLLERLSSSRRFSRIVGGADLRALLDLNAQKAALGCDTDGCLDAVAGALGVRWLAAPTLAQLGGRWIMTLKVIEVESAKVVARRQVSVERRVRLALGMEQLASETLTAMFDADAGLSAEQLVRRQSRRWMVGVGLAVGLASGGGALWSVVDLGEAQKSHSDPDDGGTFASFDALVRARDRAILTRWASAVGAAVSTGLWLAASDWMAP